MHRSSPWHDHYEHVGRTAHLLSCLANRTGVPVVYLGNPLIEASTLLLHPAKHDWHQMHQVGLSAIWASAERALQRSRRYEIGWLHPSELGRACPGVRCDGMHWNADYANGGWSCRTSRILYEEFVRDFFLREKIGSTGASLLHLLSSQHEHRVARTLGSASSGRTCYPKAISWEQWAREHCFV